MTRSEALAHVEKWGLEPYKIVHEALSISFIFPSKTVYQPQVFLHVWLLMARDLPLTVTPTMHLFSDVFLGEIVFVPPPSPEIDPLLN